MPPDPVPEGILSWLPPPPTPPELVQPDLSTLTKGGLQAAARASGVPAAAPPPMIPPSIAKGTMGADTKAQWAPALAAQRVGQQVSFQGPPGGPAAGAAVTLPPAQSGPVTPAGMQPSTESVETKGGVPVTPALAQSEQELGAATEDVQKAQADVSAEAPLRAQERRQEEAIARVHAADVAAQQAKDLATATTEENWKRDKAHAAYELAISKGVDQHKFLHDMSLGGKLATLASVALSGLGSGIQGIWGTNPGNGALKMVQDGIERDVREQTEAIDRKGKLADAADNHVALFLKEGLNKQQAQQAAASQMWGNFQKTLDEKAATLPSVNRLQAAQLQLAIAQKKNDHDMAFAKETGAVATTKVEDKWKAASGGVGGDDWATAYRKYRKDEIGKLDPKTGQPVMLMDPTAFKARWDNGQAGAPRTGADKPMSPRLVGKAIDYGAAKRAAVALSKLLGSGKGSGSSLSPTDRALADEQVAILKANGYPTAEGLALFSSSHARKAVADHIIDDITAKQADLEARGHGTSDTPEPAAATEP